MDQKACMSSILFWVCVLRPERQLWSPKNGSIALKLEMNASTVSFNLL